MGELNKNGFSAWKISLTSLWQNTEYYSLCFLRDKMMSAHISIFAELLLEFVPGRSYLPHRCRHVSPPSPELLMPTSYDAMDSASRGGARDNNRNSGRYTCYDTESLNSHGHSDFEATETDHLQGGNSVPKSAPTLLNRVVGKVQMTAGSYWNNPILLEKGRLRCAGHRPRSRDTSIDA
ncbi:hypothetical protein PNOK_0851800 [Pyrrhoderma noxium]|uniref:Uncharacterized protein n=1 Tax=Pyrrhoderma noxium TaxID=2282107 RepID=A0A286U7V9_9AGAM|nr:hypothetical protein PNOK_0851800 [Pyrrhoderma noxium]